MDNWKEKISTIGFTFIKLTYIGQARGITWYHLSMEKTQKIVKEIDKLIWMDTYIDWCRGCKLMAIEFKNTYLMLTQLIFHHRACDKANGLFQRYAALRASNVEQSQIQGLLNKFY